MTAAGDVYIICASRELDRAKAAHALARSLGLTITFDWPTYLEENIAAGRTDESFTDAAAALVALRNLDGAALARVAVFLAPAASTTTCTAYGELAIAISLATPVVLSRERGRRKSFLEACVQHVTLTDREAIVMARRLIPADVEERP